MYYSTFTYLVAGMEDFFTQLIKPILKKDNRRLLVTVKDINFKSKYDIENIVLANNKETIIDLIIEDRIISIMYANPRCQAEYFRKALSIDISDEKWNIWYEIKATRDLIVHNLGTINETYTEDQSYYPNSYKNTIGSGVDIAEDMASTITQPDIINAVDPYKESSYSRTLISGYTRAQTGNLTVTQTYNNIPINLTNYGVASSVLGLSSL